MLGDPKAQASLGEMYLKGQGVEQSYEMALEYFNQSAEVEDPKGQVGMAYLLAEGLGVDEDLEEARALLEKAATQYDPDALYNMGTFYLTGKTNNDQTNYDLAVTYFNRAISYGHTLAAYNLGLIHMHGIGSYKSCSLASNLFKFVAERGVHSLQLKEAYEKYQGGKVPQAFSRYLQLAEQGFETAQLNAELISENYNHTKILNGMLAENENPMGLLRLGDHYYYREDDKKIAFSYYRASEKLKNAQASFNIAYMYHFGEGISEDYYMALRHYNLAIERDGIAYYPVKAMLWVLDYPDIAYWLTSAL